MSSGMGSGTPRQELERWLQDAGRVTVYDEGEQKRLFDAGATRMYRLFNRNGDSLLVSQETAEAYGLRPNAEKRHPMRPQVDLFSAPQGFLFGEEV